MESARIAKLLEPFLGDANNQGLATNDLNCISTYIDILMHWNSRINLTSIRDPEEIVTRHFGESLFAARHLFPRDAHVGTAALACLQRSRRGCPVEQSSAPAGEANRERAALKGREKGGTEKEASAPEADDQRSTTDDRPTVADLGSGAGFPGLPIKLWAPHISLTLIESNQKKATFLREVTRALTLTDVNIQNARAETLPPASFDLVTLRAVERFDRILPTAAELVRPAGRLALLIGTPQQPEAQAALPQFLWQDPISLPASKSRILLVARRAV